MLNNVIDCSRYQALNTKGVTDLWKQNGIDAIIHKATEGATVTDPTYVNRAHSGHFKNILWGAFHHFSTYSTGIDQADHFLNQVELGERPTLLAVKVIKNKNGVLPNPKDVEAFVENIFNHTEIYPLIYGNRFDLENLVSPRSVLSDCPLWIAQYQDTASPDLPQTFKTFALWQYTDGQNGVAPRQIPGIGSGMRNKFFDDDPKVFQQFWSTLSYIPSSSHIDTPVYDFFNLPSMSNSLFPTKDNSKKTPFLGIHVIDCSRYQNLDQVNTASLRKQGIEAIIHKITQGIQTDTAKVPTLATYLARAQSEAFKDILWGAYHFFSPQDSGVQQAKYFLEQVKLGQRPTLLALDIEKFGGVLPEQKEVEAFVEVIYNDTKIYPLLYGNRFDLNTLVSPGSLLSRCPLWIAQYQNIASPNLPQAFKTFALWQHTDGTHGLDPDPVQGIGMCDRNKFNGTNRADFKRFWNDLCYQPLSLGETMHSMRNTR